MRGFLYFFIGMLLVVLLIFVTILLSPIILLLIWYETKHGKKAGHGVPHLKADGAWVRNCSMLG
jgi:hypothetical protein